MVFKNYRIRLIIRVFFIATFMFLFLFSISQEKWYVTSAVSLLVVFILLAELIYFIETTNRELSKFLLSIKHNDFTIHYNTDDSRNKSSLNLKLIFNEITNEFQNVRIEKELHYQYLQTVFSHSKTAIICFEENGKVQLINEATQKLLGIKRIENIEEIKKNNPILFDSLRNINPTTEKLIKLKINTILVHLSLQCSLFKIKDKSYRMISLHDVKTVLEDQELESWKKLIRVLNHEIMNSVTPISSLSSALNKMLTSKSHEAFNLNKLDAEDTEDLIESLKTIENRSKGLLKFVTNYKKITNLPQPNYTEVNILGLITHISRLLRSKLEEKNIILEISCPENINIRADHELVEQVIINLFLNAIEAVQDQKEKTILIQSSIKNDFKIIEIKDNGPGINDEVLEQIFIPFFTTKKTGSGIGLSLSKQIMQIHRGNLSVNSKIDIGSTFILKFP